jgi:toxin secretion/phage lysis holin
MKLYDTSLKYMDTLNAVGGTIVAVLTAALGTHWFLFVGFLTLNIIDYITGVRKSRLTGKDNSAKGVKGVWKKLGYWLMVLVAFLASAIFIEIGKTIGIDLAVTAYIGWFTLASLIINELRSILENFVEAGDNVPSVLTKGLEVAENAIKKGEE